MRNLVVLIKVTLGLMVAMGGVLTASAVAQEPSSGNLWIDAVSKVGLPIALVGGGIWFLYRTVWPFIEGQLKRAQTQFDEAIRTMEIQREAHYAERQQLIANMERIGAHLQEQTQIQRAAATTQAEQAENIEKIGVVVAAIRESQESHFQDQVVTMQEQIQLLQEQIEALQQKKTTRKRSTSAK